MLFTGCSLFKIRSSGVLLLFLNRPESPLENRLCGITPSGGKNDQNLLQTAASEKLYTEFLSTSGRHRVRLRPGQQATCSAGGALLWFHQIRLQVTLPSTPMLR